MNLSILNTVFIIIFLSLNCKPREIPVDDSKILGFSKGLSPVVFDLSKDSPRNFETGNRMEKNSDCKSCHEAVYKNWESSRHRVAFTNEIYKESHSRENSIWCVNCHSPFVKPGSDPLSENSRIFPEDGISCQTCHVRQGKILTGAFPKQQKLSHEYIVIKIMNSEEFCGNCHQFNFPTLATAEFTNKAPVYSNLVMQDTINEFRESSFFAKGSCVSCHLLRDTADSHKFSGGHDANRLSESFGVSVIHRDNNNYAVKITSIGIGHSFPTGDLFRNLRIRLYDGDILLREYLLKKTYEVPKESPLPEDPARNLVSDEVIPPPTGKEFSSEKLFLLKASPNLKKIKYEMIMDYLHGLNRLTTEIPIEKTMLTFKKGTIEIEK